CAARRGETLLARSAGALGLLEHSASGANAFGGGADIEPEAATRSLDQIWLRIGRAVHPTLPAPEEVDLVRARHVELEPVLLDSHRAARGRCHPVPELRGGLRACHVDRHSRERAVENA